MNKLCGYLYKFTVFARMLGRPHGVAPTNIRFIHNLFINSKLGLIIPPHLTVLSYRCIINKVNFIFKEMTVYELKNKRDFICDNGGVRLFDDVGLCASRR